MTPVRWDQTIAARLAPLIIQEMAGGLPRWRAVDQAQKALLPAELHRPVRDNFMFTGALANEIKTLQERQKPGKRVTTVGRPASEAKEWALGYLANGPATIKAMQGDALKAGFVWRDTMLNALRDVGAETYRGSGHPAVFWTRIPAALEIEAPTAEVTPPVMPNEGAKRKLNWVSPEENEQIAILAAQEMSQNKRKIYPAVFLARQAVLPSERISKTSDTYISKTLRSRIEELLAPGSAATAEPAAEVPETAHLDYLKEYPVEPPAEEVPAAPAQPSEARRPPTSIPARLNALDARLASMEWMMMRLLSIMEEHPIQLPGVQEIVNDHLPKMREIAKSKVLIVGCNSIQFQEVEKEWSPYFNLSWQHENPSQERVRGADYVIGVVRFMNHSCEHSIRKHMATRLDRYIRVNTPVVEVSRTLGVIFSKENTFQ